MNRRVFSSILIVVILAIGSASLQTTFAQDGFARLRVVHAAAGLPIVDVYIDGFVAGKNLEAGDATLHFNLAPGPHNVAVRPAGADPGDAAVLSQTVDIGIDLAYSMLIQGAPSTPQMVLYEDILDSLDVGIARLGVINAAPGVEAIDLVRTDGAPLLLAVDYGQVSGTINIPAGFFDLVVVPADGDIEDAVAPVGAVDMQSGVLYTLIVIGEAGGDADAGSSVVVLADRTDPGAGSTSLTRFVNVSDLPDGFDVYLDTTLVLSDLGQGEASIAVNLPTGEHDLSLRETGLPPNSEPFFTDSISLTGDAQTIGIGGDDGAITLTAFADSVSGVTPESARLQALNFSENSVNGALDDGTVVAIDLDGGSAGEEIDAEPGDYLLAGETELEISVLGGTLYSVIYFGDGEIVISPIHIAVDLTSTPYEQPDIDVAAEPTPVTGPDPVTAPGEITPAPAEVAAATPTAAPPPTTVPPVTGSFGDNAVLGVVTVDQGVNLQCREYPTSLARSLGLIPNNTELEIVNLAGPRDETGEEGGRDDAVLVEGLPDFSDLPDENITVANYSEEMLAELTFEDLWVDVNWIMPDGTLMGCWTSSFYLQIRYGARRIQEVPDLLNLVDLNLVGIKPYNFPGGPRDLSAGGAASAPPAPAAVPTNTDAVIAVVQLDPSVNLQLRRTPGIDGESLALVPGGSQLTVIEQIDVELTGVVGEPLVPEWLLVEYQSAEGALYRGWISAQFVSLTYRGLPYDLESVPVAEEIEVGGLVTGAGSGGVAPSPQPTSSAPIVEGRLVVNPTAQLNLRDRPSTDGIVLFGIPGTAILEVIGRNGDGSWYNVVYITESGGRLEGWVAAEFVTLSYQGQVYNAQNLPITTGEADTFGQ